MTTSLTEDTAVFGNRGDPAIEIAGDRADAGRSVRLFGVPIHFAWIVAGIVFLVLMTAAGIRATPGVLIVPLEEEFGWSRASISLAIGINIFIFGFIGPFA